jgi:hypothetical protein
MVQLFLMRTVLQFHSLARTVLRLILYRTHADGSPGVNAADCLSACYPFRPAKVDALQLTLLTTQGL